jgi:hypothetical protein
LLLHFLDPDAGDPISLRSAAYFGRTGNDGQTERKVAAVELPDNSFRKFQLNSTIFLQIGSTQLDRVEGHRDLSNRQSGTFECDGHLVFEIKGETGHPKFYNSNG